MEAASDWCSRQAYPERNRLLGGGEGPGRPVCCAGRSERRPGLFGALVVWKTGGCAYGRSTWTASTSALDGVFTPAAVSFGGRRPEGMTTVVARSPAQDRPALRNREDESRPSGARKSQGRNLLRKVTVCESRLVPGELGPHDSSSEDESSRGEPGADKFFRRKFFWKRRFLGAGILLRKVTFFQGGNFSAKWTASGSTRVLVNFDRRATLRSGEAGGSWLVSGSCPGLDLSSEREDHRWRLGFNPLRPSGSSSEEPDNRRLPIVHESWTRPQRSSFGDFGKVGSNAIRQCPGKGERGGLLRKSASEVRERV
jgi:hypothetical protein